MSLPIKIEDYSAKSFVVRGETRDYKDSLKAMGGKWNSRLTDKQSGDKFGAWLFWSDKRKELDRWFAGGCQGVESSKDSVSADKSPTRSFGSSSGTDRQTSLTIKRLESKVDRLTKMLEAVCALHDIEIEIEEKEKAPAPPKRLLKKSRRPVTNDEIVIESDDDDASLAPPKRLLAKKKPSRR